MPCVSVIIPVYNSAPYLEECLNSIRHQTLEDIEVICVDDGSTDSSLEILRRHKQEDPRFVVLSQVNSGAGVARNYGMARATGEYLSFLDSDDVFEPAMLEKLHALAIKRDLDVAVCRCDKFSQTMGEAMPVNGSLKTELLPGHAAFSASEISRDFFNAFIFWPWDKLFKRSFVERNNIEYMALRTTNDLFFVAGNMLLAGRIDYIDDILVHQRVRNESLSKTRNRSADNFYRALLELRRFLVDHDLYERYEQDFINYCASFSGWQLNSMDIEGYLSLRRELPSMLDQLGVAKAPRSTFYQASTYSTVRQILDWPETCVTILMPSLNVAPYIKQCIDSVIGQTLKNIEVLCIDAGSTDGTLEILLEYERKDPRVRVIKSDVKSYGHQLNIGLREARGEYIGIVETDDFAARDMFKCLYSKARQHKAQVVKGNYTRYQTTPFERSRAVKRYQGLPYDRVLTAEERRDLFEGGPCIWSGIYSRKFLIDEGIDFLETPGASFQDTGFILKVWIAANRVVLVDQYHLHYRVDNENSSVHSRDKAFFICDEMDSARDFLAERHPAKVELLSPVLWARRASAYKWNYDRISDDNGILFLERVKEEFGEQIGSEMLQEELFVPSSWEFVTGVCRDPNGYHRQHRGIGCEESGLLPDGPLLSVIVNAIQSDGALTYCLNSLGNQADASFEVLIVDDLSSDAASSIVRERCSTLTRCRVVSENGASAGSLLERAVGLAAGEWLLFIEGNDVLELRAIASIANMLHDSPADVVAMRHDVVSADLKEAKASSAGFRPYKAGGARPISASGVSKRILQITDPHVRRKLFRTTFVRAHNLHFCNRCYNYDIEFLAFALLGAKEIECMGSTLVSEIVDMRGGQDGAFHADQAEVLWPWIELLDAAVQRGLYSDFEETLINVAADSVARDLQRLSSYTARYNVCCELASERAMRYGIASRARLFYDSSSTYVKMQNALRAVDYGQTLPFNRPSQPSHVLATSINASDISVIIHAHNAEQCLSMCLDSVLFQTKRELEVICIDDGSTDNTWRIAEEYSRLDSRVMTVRQENLGASAARNSGVVRARGKYLYFLDGAGVLAEDALERLYDCMEAQALDVALFEGAGTVDFTTNLGSAGQLSGDYTRSCLHEATCSGGELMRGLYEGHVYRSATCMQMVRREFFIGNDLWFYPGILYGDELYTFKLLLSAKRATHIHERLYKRQAGNNAAAIPKKTFKHVYSCFKIHLEMLDWCESHNLSDEERDVALQCAQGMAIRAVDLMGAIPWEERDAYWALPPKEQAQFITTVKLHSVDQYYRGVEHDRRTKAEGKASNEQRMIEKLEKRLANEKARHKATKEKLERIRDSKSLRIGRLLVRPISRLRRIMGGVRANIVQIVLF